MQEYPIRIENTETKEVGVIIISARTYEQAIEIARESASMQRHIRVLGM